MMTKYLRLCFVADVEWLQPTKLLQFSEVFIHTRWVHKPIPETTR